MNRSPRRRFRRLAALGVVLFATLSPAFAQSKKDEQVLPPFDVSGLKHERAWVQWVFAFLFVAGVVGLAFKNPHRSHLD